MASLLLFITLACVLLGLSTQWPGIGIPLAVIALAVWARTVARVRKRSAVGVEVTSLDKVLLFLSSFATTVVLIVLVLVTAAAALFTACMAMFAPNERDFIPLIFGGALLAAIGAVAIFLISRWLFRRD